MNRIVALLSLVAILASGLSFGQSYGIPPESDAGSGSTHQVRGFVGFVNRRDLPAPEAGVLTHVGVRDGSRFEDQDILAKIDTREVEMALKIAGYEQKHAFKRATDEIEITYARAQELVEAADYDGVTQANQAHPGAVPDADVRREKLEMQRATLGIEKALKDKQLALLEVDIKRAESQAAMIAIEKRMVRAMFSGEVLKLHREEGEWVEPGETIAEIAQLDTLQVDAPIYVDEYTPAEVADCRVTVRVDVGKGQIVESTGYIVYVNKFVERDGRRLRYGVRAEFANRLENGHWLISAGLPAEMEIHLGTADGTAQRLRAVRSDSSR